MEISEDQQNPVIFLRDSIKELEELASVEDVLNRALKISLAITGSCSGHFLHRIGEDLWQMDTERNIYLSPALTGPTAVEKGVSGSDLIRFLNDAFSIEISEIVPIKVDNSLVALLLLTDRPDTRQRLVGDACLSLLNSYVSARMAVLMTSKVMQEMKLHYEEVILKKETAEKLASLGTIAAGLAHEIKNPLVSIKTLAQLLPERFDDPEFRDYFTNIAINEVDRIGSIVSDLLDFAKSSEPKVGPVDLIGLLEDTIKLLASQFADRGITVKTSFAKHIPVIEGDQFQIKQVLLNIFINGYEAMPGGGEFTVEVMSPDDVLREKNVIVKIKDTGTGITAEDKAHLFEPFFTTKPSGTGLGLSICKRIIDKHEGEIFIESMNEGETIVTLVLPVKYRITEKDPADRQLSKGGY